LPQIEADLSEFLNNKSMKTLKIITILYFVIQVINSNAQVPFHRGVNFTSWFQTSGANQIQFTAFTKQDFENIKTLGCDVVRLPINLHLMTNGAPDYIIDSLFFNFLDQAVDWVEDLQIYLLLDNHTVDASASKNPDLQAVLTSVWAQMASHYKDRSGYIIYEIMNEPNGLTTQKWGQIQQKAIDTIRKFDTKHKIIVGASNWNTYNEMNLLPVYSDTNLIYTFHFYDPMVFTHQGATWVTPSLASLSGIPFPYNADSMPQLPVIYKGTWIENDFNNYQNLGTVLYLQQQLNIAVKFQTDRKVPVFCGEYGAYMPNTHDTARTSWYSAVRQYLEQNGIPWTIWDYKGGFGLYKNGSNTMFDYDLNISLLKALGLNIPPQKKYVLKPDSVGFNLYTDYIGENMVESSNASNGILNYYSISKPNNGKYCIYWTGVDQYNNIGFDFIPDRDLSMLVENNYAVSFLVRGDSSVSSFDIRFIDLKTTKPGSHPWRMNYTIDENIAKWDSKWHKIYIPLKNFTDMGAWDNGTWIDPTDSFTWNLVDRFDIVAEHSNLKGRNFWFDNIVITNMDTAAIYDTSVYKIPTGIRNLALNSFNIFPNPMLDIITINYELPVTADVEIKIFDTTGQEILLAENRKLIPGTHSFEWNGKKMQGKIVPSGIYFCQFTSNGMAITFKIIKSAE